MLTPKFKAPVGTRTVAGLWCWPKHRLSCLILQPERLTAEAPLIFISFISDDFLCKIATLFKCPHGLLIDFLLEKQNIKTEGKTCLW